MSIQKVAEKFVEMEVELQSGTRNFCGWNTFSFSNARRRDPGKKRGLGLGPQQMDMGQSEESKE
jgi:hypothetical protein